MICYGETHSFLSVAKIKFETSSASDQVIRTDGLSLLVTRNMSSSPVCAPVWRSSAAKSLLSSPIPIQKTCPYIRYGDYEVLTRVGIEPRQPRDGVPRALNGLSVKT